MKKFAVIGNPVNHSLSPVIHKEFARQFGIDLEYKTIHAQEGEFNSKVNYFQKHGGTGLNVTVPYKADAFKLASKLSDRSRLAQAVNTLSFTNGMIYGDNTDGVGLVNDLLQTVEFKIFGKRILIVGAGGAVRGVLGPLLGQSPELIVIANRTAGKAKKLAEHFRDFGMVSGLSLDEVSDLGFDMVLNGTTASLNNQLPNISSAVLDSARLAYDMMYSANPTVFMQWASANGVSKVKDGLGMLVEQAAISFNIWHGHKPDTSEVLKYLR